MPEGLGGLAPAEVPLVGGMPRVLPYSLCSQYTHTRQIPALVNEYHDGTIQVKMLAEVEGPLIQPSRKAWSLSKRLTVGKGWFPPPQGWFPPTPVPKTTDNQLVELFTFWKAFPGHPFYFYDPFEVAPGLPPGSNWDATGASVVGRYMVKFRNDWSQSFGMVRAEVSLDLVEVA